MDDRMTKLLLMVLASLALIIVGSYLVLLATSVYRSGGDMVFQYQLGIPGIIAILVGLIGLLSLKLAKRGVQCS